MDDARLQWFKEIIYKTLSIDSNDPAFQELIEKNKFASVCLRNLISGSNTTKTCVLFYCTVEEEEVEVEDVLEEVEESEKVEVSESFESAKLDSENASVDEKMEGLDNDEDAVPEADFSEDIANNIEIKDSKRLSRKSTSCLLQIIKKNVLHFCLNITSYIPFQRYVYFLQCTLNPAPSIDSLEEAFKIMPDYFELGSINQHPLVSMNKIISLVYSPIFQDENWLSLIPPSECEMDENQVFIKLLKIF